MRRDRDLAERHCCVLQQAGLRQMHLQAIWTAPLSRKPLCPFSGKPVVKTSRLLYRTLVKHTKQYRARLSHMPRESFRGMVRGSVARFRNFAPGGARRMLARRIDRLLALYQLRFGTDSFLQDVRGKMVVRAPRSQWLPGGFAHWRDRTKSDAAGTPPRSDIKIPFEIEGQITNSVHLEHFVRVQDDRAESGGFLISERWLSSSGPNSCGEFDSWVENEVALDCFFAETGWVIEWNGSCAAT